MSLQIQVPFYVVQMGSYYQCLLNPLAQTWSKLDFGFVCFWDISKPFFCSYPCLQSYDPQ